MKQLAVNPSSNKVLPLILFDESAAGIFFPADICLAAFEKEDHMACSVRISERIAKSGAVEMIDQLQHILSKIATARLSEENRFKCVHEMMMDQAKKNPDATALCFEDQTLSYRELDTRSSQLANFLMNKGLDSGMLAGLYLERSIEMIVGLFAILKAGAAYVPIDPDYPDKRIKFIIENSKSRMVLTQGKLVKTLILDDSVEIILLDADKAAIERESKTSPPISCHKDQVAYVIYTSGTTGVPKGVMVSHKNVARLFTSTKDWYHFNKTDVWTLFHSIAFDFSVWEIFGALSHGGKLVIIPYFVSRSPKSFFDLLIKEKVTVLNQTPSAFNQLIHGQSFENAGSDLSLRWIIFGGEALNIRDLKPWFDKYGDKVPVLVNMYGITETTVHVTYRPLKMSDINEDKSIIGCAIPDLTLFILDDQLNPVPEMVKGEIHVGGAGVSLGYLDRPNLTREKFIKNPFDNGRTTLYKTGDLARVLPDKDIEYLGRKDSQVKLRGFRIELSEIESVLSRHDSVRENAVILKADQTRDKHIVAYVTGDVSIPDLRVFLKKYLPLYMIPSFFIKMGKLPLTAHGKLDKAALPPPEQLAPQSQDKLEKAAVEKELLSIWQVLLKKENINPEDDFFALGGHSLDVMKLGARISKAFGNHISIKELFVKTTVSQQAQAITASDGLENDPLVCESEIAYTDTQDFFPVSPAQQRMWILNRITKGHFTYNVPGSFSFNGPLNLDAFRQSMEKVVKRHESLRTIFILDQDALYQKVLETSEFGFEILDYTTKPHPRKAAEKEVQRASFIPFDLSKGPLLRVLLVKIADDEYMVLFNMHHIISDGWSVGILVKELCLFYDAAVNNVPVKLPELPFQYKEFAQKQIAQIESGQLNASGQFFKKMLKGPIPLLNLPLDTARPKLKTYDGDEYIFSLPEELSKKILAFCRKNRTSLFMFFSAVVKVLLHKYSSQNDIITGSPVAGRGSTNLDNQIGLYINTVVIRSKIDPKSSFRQFLSEERQTIINALLHQDYPFDRLVEEMDVARAPDRTPLFDVMVVAQNNEPFNLQLTGIRIRQEFLERLAAKFDLLFSCLEEDGKVLVSIEYSLDLFTTARIKKMGNHLIKICEAIMSDLDILLSEIKVAADPGIKALDMEHQLTSLVIPDSTAQEIDQPENQIEKSIMAIWKQSLQHEKITIHDNFFDIGGNSILLVKVHSKIDEYYPGKLNVEDLFIHTTIKAIASALSNSGEETSKDLPVLVLPQHFFALGGSVREFEFTMEQQVLDKMRLAGQVKSFNSQALFMASFAYLFHEISQRETIRFVSIFPDGDMQSILFDFLNIDSPEDLLKEAVKVYKNQSNPITVKELDALAVNPASRDVLALVSFDETQKNRFQHADISLLAVLKDNQIECTFITGSRIKKEMALEMIQMLTRIIDSITGALPLDE
ncbi:MAG: amino acid adenylation domain-containing protein [Desulfobacteraceae bacterium]|nr:amino acid adenylation domain-containing protein [Desulfobacteraceae bacterium]